MPEKTVNTKFYTFSQNNSGGYFVTDAGFGVGEDVIIEATSAADAIDRLGRIGENVAGFWEFCDCCGDRWSTWLDDSDGKDEPMIYSEPAANHQTFEKDGKKYVHYIDNSFKEI